MELMLIGGIVGLIIAVSLTVLYFIFAKFFGVQARALDSNQKASEQLARQVRKEQALQTTGRLDQIDGSRKPAVEAAAKAGN